MSRKHTWKVHPRFAVPSPSVVVLGPAGPDRRAVVHLAVERRTERDRPIILEVPAWQVRWLRWFVCDMDDGVLRACESYKEARNWFLSHACASHVISRYVYTDGYYRLTVGPDGAGKDSLDTSSTAVVREDRMVIAGWDPAQTPLYPFAGDREFEMASRHIYMFAPPSTAGNVANLPDADDLGQTKEGWHLILVPDSWVPRAKGFGALEAEDQTGGATCHLVA